MYYDFNNSDSAPDPAPTEARKGRVISVSIEVDEAQSSIIWSGMSWLISQKLSVITQGRRLFEISCSAIEQELSNGSDWAGR